MLGPDEVNRIDGVGLWKAYQKWADASIRATKQRLNLPSIHSPRFIVLAGMGGSGAACDIVSDWLATNSAIPAIVVKDFHLPRFVGRNSLVIVVSLSGNTKEMLSVLDEAIQRGCDVTALSSGGALEELCRKRGVPHNKVERILVPRASLPGMVFVTLRILDDLGVAECEKDLQETSLSLRRMSKLVSPSVPFGLNQAKKIAKKLCDKNPVIYTSSRHTSVGHHFKASMNENAKIPVDAGCYPEIFHNEVETWRASAKRAVVLLRHKDEDRELSKKFSMARRLLGRVGVPVAEVREEGGLLSSLLDWCMFLDMVSIYVAVLRKIPPIETPLLDRARLL